MKKRFCLTLLLLSNILMAFAQIAQWKMRPVYDTMYMPEGADFIITRKSSDRNLIRWTLDSFDSLLIDGAIQEFHDEVAVVTNGHDSDIIKGLLLSTGFYVRLPKTTKLHVDLSYPCFSEGYLVVRDTSGHYRYIDKTGSFPPPNYPYINAYPFFNGYSSCEYYDNLVRQTKPVRCLLDKNMKFVYFTPPDKKKDVDFVSSVNDEHVAVVVVKKKVYLYHTQTRNLIPLCAKENDINTKGQAKLFDDISKCLTTGKDVSRLKAVCGRNDTIKIYFDRFMRPTIIRYTDSDRHFASQAEKRTVWTTTLRKELGEGGYGLFRGTTEVLAPQFEDISTCFGNKAIVRKSGKYGVVQVFPESVFKVWINDNNEIIPFVHKEIKTTLRVDLPREVAADKSFIIMNNPDLCEIDISTWEAVSTRIANCIKYDCLLRIPSEILNCDTVKVDYPVQVNYDGLLSPVIHVKKKATALKYWSAKIENEQWIGDDTISFDISLNYSNPLIRDAKYGVSLSVLTKASRRIQKITETQYRCIMWNLQIGHNRIDIQVTEDGLPPVPFTHTINKKPSPPTQVDNPEENKGWETPNF